MSHDHSSHQQDSGGLGAAFLLNLVFTVIEIAGGIWTNSVAILTDAVHDLGDCLSIGLSWFLQRLSKRDANAVFTYGYRRFSVLGALITGIVLLGGVGYMAFEAVSRLMQPQAVYAPGMIGLAVLGVIANGAAVLRTRKGTSLNKKIVSWHLLEDTSAGSPCSLAASR